MKPLIPHISQSLLKSTLAALLSAVFVAAAYYLYKLNFDPDYDNRWAVAEWLINYEDGGFKRRGLSGSLSFIIQDLTGLSLSTVVFSSQLLFFGLMLFYLGKTSVNNRLNLLYLSLLFTPITLLVYAYNPVSYAGRKEMIVMFTFAYFVYHLQNSTYSKRQDITVKVLLAFGVLMHELTFFYIPYFIYAEYLQTGQKSLTKAAEYLLAVLVPVSLIALFGGEVDHGGTREILAERGVIIASGGTLQHADTVDAFYYISGYWKAYQWYIPVIILGFLPFLILVRQPVSKHKKKELTVFFTMAIAFSSPMFLLALDWGRWVHIHFMMMMILTGLFLKVSSKNTEDNHSVEKQKWLNLVALIIIIVSLFWKMDHCGYGINPGGIFERITEILS